MQHNKNQYLTGWRFKVYQLGVLLRAVRIAWQLYPDAYMAAKALAGLVKNRGDNNRYRQIRKAVVVGQRKFVMMNLGGNPSEAFDTVIRQEMHRVVPAPGYTKGLILVILAFTKKCSMRCQHCFEWDALNHKDTLSVDAIVQIVRKFQQRGLSNVELSGGEPLNRFGDLLEILHSSDTRLSDFWIDSSGYRLDEHKARQLKAAGLTGMSISLDHWDADAHDRFRGLPGAFEWVVQAARNAREAGLVVGLSLVPTREFCTRENLLRYMHLARDLGVHFVRIIEPRAVGHFALAGEEVELSSAHLNILEAFHREIQNDSQYNDFPIVEYHGVFQRHLGCGGAGERYLYIDTDGDFHACPFCRHKCGSALDSTLEEAVSTLQQASGCHTYHNITKP